MYNLIFVDDEDIVREGIRSRISWEHNGFHLCGVFEDGQTALDYLKHHPVDLVLSDISMPRMDGLVLSQRIHEIHPRTQVILLTGFDEFEYAQQALRNRVREFLLKPITAEELSQVLERTKGELDQLRQAEKEQERLQALLDDSLPLLKERFFYRLVSGRHEMEGLERRRAFFSWPEQGGYYQCAIVALPSDLEEIPRLALFEKARLLSQEGDAVFANRNEDLVLLFQDQSPEQCAKRMEAVTQEIFTQAQHMGALTICIGLGEVVKGLEEVNRSYLGAGNAIDYSRILGISSIMSIDEVRRKTRVSQEAFVSRSRQLTKALREGTGDSAQRALDEVFHLFEDCYLTSHDAVAFLARLHFRLSDFIEEMGLMQEGHFDELALTAAPRQFGRLDDAKEYFQKQVQRIEEALKERRQDAAHSRVDKAKHIIMESFNNPNFNLQEICDLMYLSTSQFSALFKEGTGHTFVEFLTEVRIDEAKALLKSTDLKSYEIAERVGYQDPRYFSSLFKKATGLTTTEYRRKVGV
ncbi:MAG: response regulator [Spirochaetales bacterium]|nr:response regulator [Spirochaetales bacterium]